MRIKSILGAFAVCLFLGDWARAGTHCDIKSEGKTVKIVQLTRSENRAEEAIERTPFIVQILQQDEGVYRGQASGLYHAWSQIQLSVFRVGEKNPVLRLNTRFIEDYYSIQSQSLGLAVACHADWAQ